MMYSRYYKAVEILLTEVADDHQYYYHLRCFLERDHLNGFRGI